MELTDSRTVGQILLRANIPDDKCWEWTGAKSRFGHGRIKLNGKLHSPHRIVYQMLVGNIPENYLVCHRCDNPSCVNPRHLFVGTHSDNMKDCAAKGRLNSQLNAASFQGAKHPNAKLTDEKVREIRLRAANGEPKKRLAREFGVHKSIIQKVIQRKRWAHVSDSV